MPTDPSTSAAPFSPEEGARIDAALARVGAELASIRESTERLINEESWEDDAMRAVTETAPYLPEHGFEYEAWHFADQKVNERHDRTGDPRICQDCIRVNPWRDDV